MPSFTAVLVSYSKTDLSSIEIRNLFNNYNKAHKTLPAYYAINSKWSSSRGGTLKDCSLRIWSVVCELINEALIGHTNALLGLVYSLN